MTREALLADAKRVRAVLRLHLFDSTQYKNNDARIYRAHYLFSKILSDAFGGTLYLNCLDFTNAETYIYSVRSVLQSPQLRKPAWLAAARWPHLQCREQLRRAQAAAPLRPQVVPAAWKGKEARRRRCRSSAAVVAAAALTNRVSRRKEERVQRAAAQGVRDKCGMQAAPTVYLCEFCVFPCA